MKLTKTQEIVVNAAFAEIALDEELATRRYTEFNATQDATREIRYHDFLQASACANGARYAALSILAALNVPDDYARLICDNARYAGKQRGNEIALQAA